MTDRPSWKDTPIGSVILEPGNSVRYRTGDWAVFNPLYTQKTPPCSNACPAGVNIQGFIARVVAGDYMAAWELIKESSPFPGVIGHVCYHPCEGACNRGQHDEAIAINHLERFVAEYAHQHTTPTTRAPWREEKVAIVGSGPSGLSCAYHLARRGFPVTVFESLPLSGGILRIGIPEYRLPRAVLDREIADIEHLGVRIVTETRIGRDITFDELRRDYRAMFVGIGAHRSISLDIPNEDAEGVMTAMGFLQQVNLGRRGFLWESGRLAVIGGGNAAMDAARCARRLGAKPVVVYRRSRDEMPANINQVEEAIEEGVEFLFLAAPARVLTEGGRVSGLECIRMRLGEPDASGRRHPEPQRGSEFVLDVVGVISAIGHQIAEMELLPSSIQSRDGWIATADNGTTSMVGVFAGGDVVTGPAIVSQAIGAGRVAAEGIAAYIDGKPIETAAPPLLATFDKINAAYFPHQPRTRWPIRPVAARLEGFAEVNLGFSETQARAEADRCFSCGVCNLCGNCWIFCPDIAVVAEDGKRMVADLEYCKGCGICAKECPRAVIEMHG